MKNLLLLSLILILPVTLQAQNLAEKIAFKACDCLDVLETLQQVEDSTQNCITRAMAYIVQDGTVEEINVLSSGKGVIAVYSEVREWIPVYCTHVRHLTIAEDLKNYYKKSQNNKANEYYQKGTEYMNNAMYDKAIKELQKAIKTDKNFVFAYDHLAISYRRKEDYKKALHYYQKSLELCPFGNVALLNTAVVYLLTGTHDKALNFYEQLKFYHPYDPEGYFGVGKIALLQSDYENALENMFVAYIMYKNSGSTYIKDSQDLISLAYATMKDNDQLELFLEIANKYNIEFNE